jgi:LssY C-terminus
MLKIAKCFGLDNTGRQDHRKCASASVLLRCHSVIFLFLCLALTLAGCAITFDPKPTDIVPFKERAQTQAQDDLTVTVAVPTLEEAKAIYGVDMSWRGMQPVWVEVKNEGKFPVWLLPSGLDPAYFSASEAAYPFRKTLSKNKGALLHEHFQSLQFRNPIQPGTTASGFLIVHRDEGYKAVDIDIISREKSTSFTYIVLDPTFKGDFTLVDFDTLYDSSQIIELEDEEALRQAIEKLPCCTTNKNGTEQGDPLNLVLIGDNNDIFPAFIRRGWHGTETIWSGAILRTLKSFLQGSRYRYSPVSPLYLYGRQQDLAAQKARGTIHKRNHLRLWMSPLRFRGKPVWVGQISRDIGVKFTTKSPTISTHVIDPNVDEARRYLTEDLAYSQAMTRLGFVKGVGEVKRDAPRFNLVGDPYFTDGLRVVMFFEARPYSLGELDIISDWEIPTRAKTQAGKGLFDESE